MNRFIFLLFCFFCITATAQPVWVLNKSYAKKFYYIDSLYKNTNDYTALPAQIAQMKANEKWAAENDDNELAGEFILLEYRKKIHDPNLRNGLSESKLLELAASADKDKLVYLEADVLQMIGDYYGIKDKKYIQSIEKYLTAYKLYKDFDPVAFPPKFEYLYSLGSTYYRYDDIENALQFFKEALATKPAYSTNYYSIDNTIGLCYRKLKKYDSSEWYFQKVYQSALTKNEKQWIAIAGGNIGIVYFYQGRYAEAIPLLEQDIQQSRVTQVRNAANSMSILASIYISRNERNKAKDLLTQALEMCEQKPFWPEYTLGVQLYAQLGKVYAAENNMRLAYRYADSALAAKDSVDAAHNALNLAKAQEKSDFLQHKLEAEHQENQEKILAFRRNFLLAGIVVAVIIGILAINRQRLKQKKLEAEKKHAESELTAASVKLESYREINIQKKIVEEKNNELSQTIKDLEETQSQLIQAEKMASLGQLTAGIAHEINNPVNFISAGIDPLRKDIEDILEVVARYDNVIRENSLDATFLPVENFKKKIDIDLTIKETAELLEGMEEGALRTANIVKGLKNFSRLDQNVLKPANLNEGLESTLTMLYPVYKNKIKIVKEYGDIPEINCYPGQLNQVFMNILSNAIQAIAGHGEIFVKTIANNNFVKVFIRDTGGGMSKEVLSKIFDPFFTTKEVGKGTGLGLSISYGIVQKHKGTIEVFSELNKGTEFVITIPQTQEI